MTILIPVVFKHSRIHSSFKYWGGVLNPNKQYYTRRVTGNVNPIKLLHDMVKEMK